MKIKFLLVCVVLTGILTSTGCKKGDTGPAGPTGAAGAAGNANVQSFTFSFTAADWVADTVAKQWSADFTLPSTANVSGAVLLYAQDGSNWAALPHVDYGITFEFGFDPATRIIEVQSADATALTMIGNPGAMTFKAVTVPPAAKKTNPNVDFKNFEEVRKAFNC